MDTSDWLSRIRTQLRSGNTWNSIASSLAIVLSGARHKGHFDDGSCESRVRNRTFEEVTVLAERSLISIIRALKRLRIEDVRGHGSEVCLTLVLQRISGGPAAGRTPGEATITFSRWHGECLYHHRARANLRVFVRQRKFQARVTEPL
jgi:hypothetical protein